MVKYYLNLSIFTVFLNNRNFISKIKRSKVTDYAALIRVGFAVYTHPFRLRGRTERWHTWLFTLFTCQPLKVSTVSVRA